MNNIEMKIIDAKFRIKEVLKKTDGKMYLSFSGGKDSTVVAHLIKEVQEEEGWEFAPIPFVFSNTGLELPQIIDFVKGYDYCNKVTVYPKMRPEEVFEKYGKPLISKRIDHKLAIYQNKINAGYTKEQATDPVLCPVGASLVGRHSKWPSLKIANKSKWALDTKIKVSNKCCDKLKKQPMDTYLKESGSSGYFTGVRIEESRFRKANSNQYYKQTSKTLVATPIYDWTSDDVEEFINLYNIEVSVAYSMFNLDRTGCYVCPYAKTLFNNLEAYKENDKRIYDYAYKLLGDVYEEKKRNSKQVKQCTLFDD